MAQDLVKKFEKIYIGKKVLNYDFTITAAGINGAVKEFGEQAVDEFFCDGKIAHIGGRSVWESMKDHGKDVSTNLHELATPDRHEGKK